MALHDDLITLSNCADEWSTNNTSLSKQSANILHALHSLPLTKQKLFYHLLVTLLGAHWPKQVLSLFENGFYKLPPALWLTRLGPRGLAAGWTAGKTTEVIIKDAEEAWLRANNRGWDFEYKIEVLETFAAGLRCWAAEVEAASVRGLE